MKRRIRVDLSESGVTKAIEELRDYKRRVEEKTEQLLERLAVIGAREASVRFASAIYDGTNDAHISVEKSERGWTINAAGQAVAFIEFGAGVYHNTAEPYPSPPGRPGGIAGIGEYGKGHGKQQTWGYYDDSGNLVLTHGNPAAMPMYYAAREIEREILHIAREVFGSP